MEPVADDEIASPESLKEQRENRLLEKWANGDALTKSQLEEIKHRLPAGLQPAPFHPERKRFQKQRGEYCEIYGVRVRAIDRWLATGRAANLTDSLDQDDPKHLPPLDDPHLMPAWWADHMKQRVPAKLLALSAIKKSDQSPPPDHESIDIKSLGLGADDEPLQQARRYLAAADLRLSKAYASGRESEITLCSRIWQTASKTLREAQAAARNAAISAGEYVRIADVGSDLAQFLEMFRNMHSSLRRRVLARVGDVPADIADRIGAAIDSECETDQEFLRRLPFLDSTPAEPRSVTA